MKFNSRWPKRPVYWTERDTLYISVPFTWNMPRIKAQLQSKLNPWKKTLIGGPGAYLTLFHYPEYLAGLPVEVRGNYPGVLQRINPLATRATTGCVHFCRFCGIGQGIIEPGGFKEFDDWPDLPVYVDNNVLAASESQFDMIMARLERHGWGDFEQGLDARLLTEYHAERFARVKKLVIRLALDTMVYKMAWEEAYENLRRAGIGKQRIRSYALIGFDSSPDEAWARCQYIEKLGVDALPMWYHRLNAMDFNKVTKEQEELGWNDYERRRIMQWYYHHKEAVKR